MSTRHWRIYKVCCICQLSWAMHGNSPSQFSCPARAQFTCLPHGLRHLELCIQQTQRRSGTHDPSIPSWKSNYRVQENGVADFVTRRGCVWSRRLSMVNELPSPKAKHARSISALVVMATSRLTRRLEAEPPWSHTYEVIYPFFPIYPYFLSLISH